MSDLELIADLIREQHGTDVTAQDLAEIQMFLWERSQDRKLSLIDRGHPDYDEYINADVGKVIGFVVGAALGAFLLPGLGIVAGWVTGALVGGAIGMKLASVFDGPAKIEPAKTPVKTTSDPVFGFSGVGGLVTLNTPIPKIYGNRSNNPEGGVKFRDPPRVYTRVYSLQGTRYLESISVLAYGNLAEINTSGIELDDKPKTDFFAEDVVVEYSTGNPDQYFNPSVSIRAFSQAVAVTTNAYVGIYTALSADAVSGQFNSGGASSNTGGSDTGLVDVALQNLTNADRWDSGLRFRQQGWQSGAVSQIFNAGGAVGSYIYIEAQPAHSGTFQYLNQWGLGITSRGSNTYLNAEIGADFYPQSFLSPTTPDSSTNGGWRVRLDGNITSDGLTNLFNPENNNYITWRPVMGLRITKRASSVRIEVIVGGQVIADIDRNMTYPESFYAGFYGENRSTGILFPKVQVYRAVASPTPTPAPVGSSDTYTVDANSIGRLTSGHIYKGDATGDLFVVSRDLVASTVRFSRPFNFAPLDRVYRAHITTSKRVNRVELTLKALVSAKNDQGELVEHAEAFSVSISKKTQILQRTASGAQVSPEGVYRCGHFAIRSRSEQAVIYTIVIEELPLDFYQITINPLKSNQLIAPVRYLTPGPEGLLASEPDQARIDGLQIRVRAEVADLNIDTLRGLMSYQDKRQLSSEAGPTIQITHINEVVYATETQLAYNGYKLGYTRLIASDRLQNATAETWDIPRGAIVPNYLFYGTTIVGSDSRADLVWFASPMVQGAVSPGDRIRLLGIGTRVITEAVTEINRVSCFVRQVSIETTIGSSTIRIPDNDNFNWAREGMPIVGASIPADSFLFKREGNNSFVIASEFGGRRLADSTTSATIVTLNEVIPQVAGREAIIYRMEASNYFPDLYVDRLINPLDGLGNLVDRDHFIDYKSIVYSRRFCVRNQFYFDGVVGEGSFEQWATTAAPSSLLFCTEIQGRYALIPQERATKKPYLFIDGNGIQYSEPGVSWHQQLTNTLLVKYQDNLGREQQIKIATQAVVDRTEPEITQTINTQGVTRYAQALQVGQVALKSLRLQGKTCQIITDVANGLYCIQGDIIRTQHAQIQLANERSGIVMEVRNYGNSTRSIIQTVGIAAINNRFLIAADNLQIKFNADGSTPDDFEVSGSAGNDGTYAGSTIAYVDNRTFYIPSTSSANTPGGTLRIYRYFNDIEIRLSETIAIDGNSRITLCHRISRLTELDKQIVDLGGGWYRVLQVEEPLAAGDAFAIGQLGSFIRQWRVVSIQPDIANNKVTLAGVLWDDDILTTTGLVVL